MTSIISFTLVGIVFGIAAVLTAVWWVFTWGFGDFGYGLNRLSIREYWIIPCALILAVNLFCVWISPRISKGIEVHWWHYLAAVAGFVLGIIIVRMNIGLLN